MKRSIQGLELKKLSTLRPGRFLLSAAGDWILVAAAFAAYLRWPNPAVFIASSLVVAIAQHGMAVLGHEAVHHSITRNRTLNDWIGRLLCFFPLGMSVTSYREFHFLHHRNLGLETDPEIPLLRTFGKHWTGPLGTARFFKLWATSFVGSNLKEMGLFSVLMPKGKVSEKIAMLAYWGAALGLAAKTGHLNLVGLWFFTLPTSYWAIFRYRAWYEHNFVTTQTNRYAMPFYAFRLIFPHNIWLHYEHHRYPSVPFYNLEAVRRLDAQEKILTFAEISAHLAAGPARPEAKGEESSQRAA